MAEEMLSTSFWLSIKQTTRKELSDMFDIKRSRGTVVENLNGTARVMSDGYTSEDLNVINIKSLQDKLNTESTDFYKMLKALIKKIEKNDEKTTNEE